MQSTRYCSAAWQNWLGFTALTVENVQYESLSTEMCVMTLMTGGQVRARVEQRQRWQGPGDGHVVTD